MDEPFALEREHAEEAESEAFARFLARAAHPGDVLLLSGPLGVGKTSFARAFIRALCGMDTEVPSPSFTLVQQYETPDVILWHYDLYRLDKAEEILELDLDEAMTCGIVLIEWPERLGAFRPGHALELEFAFAADQKARRIRIAGPPSWSSRLAALTAPAPDSPF